MVVCYDSLIIRKLVSGVFAKILVYGACGFCVFCIGVGAPVAYIP